MSRLFFIAKLGATVAVLWFLLRRVDLSVVASDSFKANPLLLIVGLLQFLITPILGAWRWQVVIRSLGHDVPFSHLLRYVWISIFFGQVLPASVGPDGVRIWLAWRDKVPIRLTVHSIGLERVVMVFCLLVLVLALQRFSLAIFDWGHFAYLPALMVAGAVAGMALLLMADHLTLRLPRWWIVRAIANLSADARLLLLRPSPALQLFVISLLSHLNFAVSAWWIAVALGLNVGLFDCIVLIPLVTLITLIPISIGGWGIREGALVFLLGGIGVPASGALALSILFGLAGILTSLPGSIMWWLGGYRIGTVNEIDAMTTPETNG
jgi:uncharacterized protein (TIRG00374 family)